MGDTEWPDLSAAVGHHVRQLREDAGVLQSELAAEMRLAGQQWTQSTVAALETGRRGVKKPEELVALSFALQVPLSALLAGSDGRVQLRPGVWLDLAGARASIAADDPVISRESLHLQRLADAFHEHRGVEEHAAQRLGVDVADVRRAASELWGISLGGQRDRLMRGSEGLDVRSRQARRGHVTRALLDELRAHLSAHAEEKS